MIRLQRTGRRNDPHFRVVVTEKTTSPKGKYLELLGFVNPIEKKRSVNKERALFWIAKGAQLSDTVTNLLVSEKILSVPKIPKHKVSKKIPDAPKSPVSGGVSPAVGDTSQSGDAAQVAVPVAQKQEVPAPAAAPAVAPAEKVTA